MEKSPADRTNVVQLKEIGSNMGDHYRQGTSLNFKNTPLFLKSGGSVKALFETNRHFMDHVDHMDKMDEKLLSL